MFSSVYITDIKVCQFVELIIDFITINDEVLNNIPVLFSLGTSGTI